MSENLGQQLTNWLTSNTDKNMNLDYFIEELLIIDSSMKKVLNNYLSDGLTEQMVISRALKLQNYLICETPIDIFNLSLLAIDWSELNTYLLHDYITWSFSRNCENAKQFLKVIINAKIDNADFLRAIHRFTLIP
jgi:hypothetical protein